MEKRDLEDLKRDLEDLIGMIIGLILEIILLKLVWNSIMPYLFNLPTINYWQSFLLNMLCGILFISRMGSNYLRQIRDKLDK
jgi:hypothetical protein